MSKNSKNLQKYQILVELEDAYFGNDKIYLSKEQYLEIRQAIRNLEPLKDEYNKLIEDTRSLFAKYIKKTVKELNEGDNEAWIKYRSEAKNVKHETEWLEKESTVSVKISDLDKAVIPLAYYKVLYNE